MSAPSPALDSTFKVSYPFDGSNASRPDMVLRSADGVDFCVMKGILAVASPAFQDMTTLAEPLRAEEVSSELSKDGLPIVVMYESTAIVLDALLRIIYPVIPPKLDNDLDLVSGLLCAAQKYDMASVLLVVEDALRGAVGERSLEVYLIACEYRLEEIARLAGREFLRRPDGPRHSSGLEKYSANTLFQLFDYRRRVADAVDVLFAPLKTSKLPPGLWCIMRDIECSTKNLKPAEGCGAKESGYNISSWWATLRESVRGEIQKAPLSENVINIGLISQAACLSKCCSNCREKVSRQLPTLEATIKQEMLELAAEVKFELPW